MSESLLNREIHETEKASQLQRIQRSACFENHPKLFDLLKNLVEAEISGKKFDEDEIGRRLFDKADDWLPVNESAVRERKRLLKKQLKIYYDDEGTDDPIIFDIPRYGQLKALRNRHYEAAALVDGALKLREETFPVVIDRYSCKVVGLLQDCIDQFKFYTPAYVALAESLLMYAACDCFESFPAGKTILRAQSVIETAISRDGGSCVAHLISGALHSCRCNWGAAEQAFEQAKKIDVYRAEASFYYIAYLCATDRLKEARKHFEASYPLSTGRHRWLLEAWLRYLEDDMRMSYGALMEYSVYDRAIELDKAYQNGERILRFDFWPANLLGACIFLRRGLYAVAARYAEAVVTESNVNAFFGILVLTYALNGKQDAKFAELAQINLRAAEGDDQPRAFCDLDEPKPVSAFSRALAYLEMGDKQMSLRMLALAAEEAFPLMMFAPSLHLFDGLRGENGFKALMERIRPSRVNGLGS